ncbi:hypothetical protein L083_3842 [Actinoplanes sp. N902-109]|nr:hypothetical protein L083_3842 [Actinoplanes sp. N902-109]
MSLPANHPDVSSSPPRIRVLNTPAPAAASSPERPGAGVTCGAASHRSPGRATAAGPGARSGSVFTVVKPELPPGDS